MASAYMFSHYWPGDGITSGPSPSTNTGWFSAPSLGAAGIGFLWFLLLFMQPGLAAVPPFLPGDLRPWLWRMLTWAVTRMWPWLPLRWRLVWRVILVLHSPGFERARTAVQTVAVTPGMRTKHVWGEIGQRVGQLPGVGENVFRHLRATELMGEPVFGQMHLRNLALELAHLALKDKMYRG